MKALMARKLCLLPRVSCKRHKSAKKLFQISEVHVLGELAPEGPMKIEERIIPTATTTSEITVIGQANIMNCYMYVQQLLAAMEMDRTTLKADKTQVLLYFIWQS